MQQPTPTTVVENYFHALAEGRVPEALAAFAPDVIWHQPGANRFSGDHQGPAAVAALIGAMMEASQGSLVVAPNGPVMGNGELVAVPVHFSGQRGELVLDQDGVDLLRVRGSKIVEVHLFSADGLAEDHFWGQA